MKSTAFDGSKPGRECIGNAGIPPATHRKNPGNTQLDEAQCTKKGPRIKARTGFQHWSLNLSPDRDARK